MIIRKEKFDSELRQRIVDELDDLMLYLHEDDSTGELARVTEKFKGQAIAKSLPVLMDIDMLLRKYEDDNIDKVILEFDMD